jgi:hypothetical protein
MISRSCHFRIVACDNAYRQVDAGGYFDQKNRKSKSLRVKLSYDVSQTHTILVLVIYNSSSSSSSP